MEKSGKSSVAQKGKKYLKSCPFLELGTYTKKCLRTSGTTVSLLTLHWWI